MKIISFIFLLLPVFASGQSDVIFVVGEGSTSYECDSSQVITATDYSGLLPPTATDTLKAEILNIASDALKRGDYGEFTLWYVLVFHYTESDFEYYYKEIFPLTLDLHIRNQSWCANAAKRIKKKYFPD